MGYLIFIIYFDHQVFDGKKKLVGSGDCYPSPIKTLKGKHVVRLQVKHSSITVLESLNDMPMLLQRPIKAAVALNFYQTQTDTLLGSDKMKMSSKGVTPGGSVSFFLKEPSSDSIPKGASPGDVLAGTITYLKKDNATLGSGTKPGGYEVKYIVGDTKAQSAEKEKEKSVVAATATAALAATAATATATATATEVVTTTITTLITAVPTADDGDSATPKETGMEVAVREAKTKYLKSLTGLPAFDPLYIIAEGEYPLDLALKLVALSHTVKLKVSALAAHKKLSSAETTGTTASIVHTIIIVHKIINVHTIINVHKIITVQTIIIVHTIVINFTGCKSSYTIIFIYHLLHSGIFIKLFFQYSLTFLCSLQPQL